jgi:molybdate transport system ATP-binding protein
MQDRDISLGDAVAGGEPDGEITPIVAARLRGRIGDFALDADFTVPGQGVTALFGPSGSGKTTTLRAIAGLHRLAGDLSVAGETWQSGSDVEKLVFVPPHLRSIGYVFQEASLFPHLTVADNILFAARRPGWRSWLGHRPDAETESRLDELAQVLGISHLLTRYPAHLSGGERQRVAIARAVLPAPKLLLMDEPLSAVDRSTKDEILTYLDLVSANFEMPILYVSHDLSEITRIADHLVLMGKGRVRAQGPIDELLTRLDLNPDLGRFEAGVLLSARVLAHDADMRVTRLALAASREGGKQDGGCDAASAEGEPQTATAITVPGLIAAPGELVRLRVRARDVSLATQRPEGISIRNILPGVVREIAAERETGFAETLVDVGPSQVRARITRDAVTALGLSEGSPVFVLIKAISFDGRARRPTRASGRGQQRSGE